MLENETQGEGVPVPVGTSPLILPVGIDRPVGQLVPGEKGAPPVAPYDLSLLKPADEVPFASPPPPQPGVPVAVSTHSELSGVLLPVAPGTVLPDGVLAAVGGKDVDPDLAKYATATTLVPPVVPTVSSSSPVMTTAQPQPSAIGESSAPVVHSTGESRPVV